MTRWFFVWLLGGAGLLSAIPPNIIVFMVDDYDKYETSVYGGKVLTPNLDRLAREGITFENAHVTSTVCTPSRYTFLTGRYAGSAYSAEFLELSQRAAKPAGLQRRTGTGQSKRCGAAG